MSHDPAYLAKKKIIRALRLGATELDLSFMKLTVIPKSLEQCTQLTKLNLSRNCLKALPESLGKVTQLQELLLYENQLTTLPKSLGQLKQLQRLNVSDNRLTTVPEALGQLAQLQALNLANNVLSVLPEVLRQLKNLSTLAIGSCYLNEMPGWIIELTNLQSLSLAVYPLVVGSSKGHGRLSSLPSFGGGQKSIKFINISGNQFLEVPSSILELEYLESLIATSNRIKSISPLPARLKRLKALNLEGNQLTDIPSSLIELEHLEILELSENPLNPKLAEAYKLGLDGVKAYLRGDILPKKAIRSTNFKPEEYHNKRKLKVFLCYASQDKALIYELYQKLITEGWIEPWLDTKKLLPGQDWQAEIKNAVKTADNVIIFLSNTSTNKDGFIQKELRFAKDIALEKVEGSIFLIPLRIDDCEVPKSLEFYQWANYFGEDKEQTYNNLLESLKLRLEDLKRKETYVK